MRAQVVDRQQVAGRDHADDQLAILTAQRHSLVLVADVLGKQRPQRRVADLGTGKMFGSRRQRVWDC